MPLHTLTGIATLLHPTSSAEGAAVHFIDLKDGQTVPPKVTIRFGLREMGVAPAGSDRANSGHHHLLTDTELPPLDQPGPPYASPEYSKALSLLSTISLLLTAVHFK